jgi:internalin A
LVSVTVLAVVVNFPDPGLEAAIREAIGKPTGDIYDTDLVGLTTLDANSCGVSNLEGMQHCVDLTELYLWDNQIVSISALAGLTDLTGLALGINRIVNISSLSSLTNLTWLNLWDNQILDISPLSSLINLTWLGLGNNQIVDISPLSSLTSLTWLYMRYNQIVDISPLSSLTSLTWLGLGYNQIIGISALSGLANLMELRLFDNQIIDISALASLANLTYLNAGNNQIVDISPISGLTNLTELYLWGNQIIDISPISGLTNLTRLNLSHHQLVNISSLAGLTNLTELGLHANQIVDISPLSGLINLTELWLFNNQIVDISTLAGLINLAELDLDSNQIADIAPLVSNAGIGSGDDLDVRWNNLDLTPGSADMDDINTLLGRGVSLQYDPQKTAAVFRVDAQGNVLADGPFYGAEFYSGSADVAEWVSVSESVEPGDVLELDPENPGHYRKSRGPCSTLVAGVVSTAPGFILGSSPVTEGLSTPDSALLALLGIVPVKVTDEGGPIQPGDLLVTSSTPGHAMCWAGSGLCPCALVGKALEPLETERGIILVLLAAH